MTAVGTIQGIVGGRATRCGAPVLHLSPLAAGVPGQCLDPHLGKEARVSATLGGQEGGGLGWEDTLHSHPDGVFPIFSA